MYTFIYMYTHTCIQRRTYTLCTLQRTAKQCDCNTQMYAYTHIYTYTHIHIYIHTYIHIYIRTNLRIYICTYVHMCIYTRTHTFSGGATSHGHCSALQHTATHKTCVYTYIPTYIITHICIFIYTRTHTCIYIYTRTHTCSGGATSHGPCPPCWSDPQGLCVEGEGERGRERERARERERERERETEETG